MAASANWESEHQRRDRIIEQMRRDVEQYHRAVAVMRKAHGKDNSRPWPFKCARMTPALWCVIGVVCYLAGKQGQKLLEMIGLWCVIGVVCYLAGVMTRAVIEAFR